MKLFWVLVLIFISNNVWAVEQPLGGARSLGLGGASVTNKDVYAVVNNQAALGSISSYNLAIAAERRFMISTINSFGCMATIPTKTGTFGMAINYFGNSLYNEKKIGLGFGKKLGTIVQLGLQLNFFNRSISTIGAENAYSYEIGSLINLNKSLRIGMHLFNPIVMKSVKDFQSELQPNAKLGLGWQISKKIFYAVEVQSDLLNQVSLKTGLEYNFYNKFYARVGYFTNPSSYTFGIGYYFKMLKFEMATSLHQVLGTSLQVGITYSYPKKLKKSKP
jgi:hypothetical protein